MRFPVKITSSCIWVAIPVYWVILHSFGMPVVRTDGRLVGRSTVTWLPNFLGWVVYHIFVPIVLRCARFARESSVIINFGHLYAAFFLCQLHVVENFTLHLTSEWVYWVYWGFSVFVRLWIAWWDSNDSGLKAAYSHFASVSRNRSWHSVIHDTIMIVLLRHQVRAQEC